MAGGCWMNSANDRAMQGFMANQMPLMAARFGERSRQATVWRSRSSNGREGGTVQKLAVMTISWILATGTAARVSAQADSLAILALVQEAAREARRAWDTRDARQMFATVPETTVVRTPDGRAITKADMIADLQRRMNMTTRIDTMAGSVDSLRFLGPDEAVVFSSQRFVREMVVPGQQARVRISSVTHRQVFRRVAAQWRVAGPIEESNQRARWADQPEGP